MLSQYPLARLPLESHTGPGNVVIVINIIGSLVLPGNRVTRQRLLTAANLSTRSLLSPAVYFQVSFDNQRDQLICMNMASYCKQHRAYPDIGIRR